MNVLNMAGLSYSKIINEYGNTNRKIQASKFEDDLKLLLMTEKGTMIGNPNFGSDLYKFLFNKDIQLTASLIRDEIKKCVEENFDFVKINNIDVEFDTHNVNVKITYGLYIQDSNETVMLSFLREE